MMAALPIVLMCNSYPHTKQVDLIWPQIVIKQTGSNDYSYTGRIVKNENKYYIIFFCSILYVCMIREYNDGDTNKFQVALTTAIVYAGGCSSVLLFFLHFFPRLQIISIVYLKNSFVSKKMTQFIHMYVYTYVCIVY